MKNHYRVLIVFSTLLVDSLYNVSVFFTLSFQVTTTDDPIIRKLTKTEGNVYATDAILATIMCCTRSNYSWDIVIEKLGIVLKTQIKKGW